MKTRDDTPTQPLPMSRRGKIARIAIKKMPAVAPHHAAPARPADATKRGEVRTGALLDPFGLDD